SVRRRSIECSEGEKERVMSELPDELRQVFDAEFDSTYGIRLEFADDNAWALVRPSGTEPVIRVYAEDENERKGDELLDEVVDVVEKII
ncbi:MAG: hypothetical protein SXQ77_05825, partial [Halobacteria archaeon]|nr:hypothetical protein [Halobacteria archaeon]